MWPSCPQARLFTRAASLVSAGDSAVTVSLDVLKREAGDHWPKMREGIHVRLENLLRLALGPASFFAAIDDETWLIVTPQLTAEEALACCLKVAYVLHVSLMGPCGLDSIHIALAAPLDAEGVALTPAPMPQLRVLAETSDLYSSTLEVLAHFPLQRLPVPQGSGVMFEPVWDAALEVVHAWRCVGLFPAPRSKSPHKRAAEMSERALATLRCAADALEDQLRRGRKFAVHVPVPFESLAAIGSRMEFIAACRTLPSELRPFLTFELTGIPDSLPQATLANPLAAIQPFARAVLAQVPGRASSLGMFAKGSIRGIGIDLSDVAYASQRPLIARLAAAAKRTGATAFLRGVASFDAVDAALERNIGWMSGPAITPCVEVPQQVLNLPIESLACVTDGASSAGVASVQAMIERHLATRRQAHPAADGRSGLLLNPARAADSRRPVRS